jgi:flagellar motor protein MotB
VRVSEKLRELGLQPSNQTLAAERAQERVDARVDIARARRRATHLEARAARKPLNSNGRKKDVATAAQLRASASHLATAQGLE